MKKLTENDYLFDGFAERRFDPKHDGWRNALADPADYSAVTQASNVLEMFDEIQQLRRENWDMKQELERLRPLVYGKVA
jgi:hypothetical protein